MPESTARDESGTYQNRFARKIESSTRNRGAETRLRTRCARSEGETERRAGHLVSRLRVERVCRSLKVGERMKDVAAYRLSRRDCPPGVIAEAAHSLEELCAFRSEWAPIPTLLERASLRSPLTSALQPCSRLSRTLLLRTATHPPDVRLHSTAPARSAISRQVSRKRISAAHKTGTYIAWARSTRRACAAGERVLAAKRCPSWLAEICVPGDQEGGERVRACFPPVPFRTHAGLPGRHREQPSIYAIGSRATSLAHRQTVNQV